MCCMMCFSLLSSHPAQRKLLDILLGGLGFFSLRKYSNSVGLYFYLSVYTCITLGKTKSNEFMIFSY